MEAYFDVKAPSSYGGIDALYRLMKQKGENITRKQVVNGARGVRFTQTS